MDINFEHYKVFYNVAKLGSFSAAAKELFISQSAVSQSIKTLEEQTGSVLFARGPRTVKLTAVGEMLFSHVEQAYNLIRAAEGKIREMQSYGLGEIKIGVGDTILRFLLIPFLQKFIIKYPKIKLQIINRTSSGIIESLKSGAVDLGIVTLPVEDKDVETMEFRTVEDVFVASDRFAGLKNKSVTTQELSQLPLLLLQKESLTRRNLDAFFNSKGLTIVPEIELESMELLIELSKIGLGIAYVLRESAVLPVSEGELFILRTKDHMPVRKLGLARLRNVPLSPASELFISELGNVQI
ncbi:MAG TPA: LysR family transcriptional regulator [Clostridia bacterium]|nr:LysR family transcriptional regulator [Clostridia bacterium]